MKSSTAVRPGSSRAERILDPADFEDISSSPDLALTEAWTKMIEFVDNFQQSLPRATQANPQESSSRYSAGESIFTWTLLESPMAVLKAGGLVDVLRAYVLSVLDKKVRDEVAPRFWALLAPESSKGWRGPQPQQQEGQQKHGNATGSGETNGESAMLEHAGEESVLSPLTRREAYGHVKRALQHVAEEVNSHLALVRALDSASAAAASPTGRAYERITKARCGGSVLDRSSPPQEETIEARYRCAFTAQVMAGARGDFQGMMRAFFDRNLRFWHRGWVERRRQERRERRERRWHQSDLAGAAGSVAAEDDDHMVDVLIDHDDDDGEEEEDEEGGDANGVADGGDAGGAVDESTMEMDQEGGEQEDCDDGGQLEQGGERGAQQQQEEGKGMEDDDDEEEEEMEEEEEEEDSEQEQEDNEHDDFADMTTEELLEIWGVLRRLGWFSLLQDAFSGVMSSHVLAYVRSRCDGVYDVPVLNHVMAWKDQVLLRWIALLLRDGNERHERERKRGDTDAKTANTANTGEDSMFARVTPRGDPLSSSHAEASAASFATPGFADAQGNSRAWVGDEAKGGHFAGVEEGPVDHVFGWAQRLGLAVHEAFCSARIAELFDIIADYPDSAVAIGELKTSLGVTQQHQRLAILLRDSVRRRLLHPGANTHQIIDVYIATIKVLRILDPKDVLLETVAGPVRRYLRARKDTVRCIVASLTDETSGDLYEELRRQDARPLDGDDGSDEDDDGPVAPNWEPASRDADPTSGNRSGSDILTMLVSIYGSKELFVTEYRLMLADKLVNNLAYDTDKEVQNLELLKLRFGDDSMHQCEIMVRDVEESKRVNANVQERLAERIGSEKKREEASCLDAVMVSQHFWPQLLGEDMRLHPSMEKRLDEFSKAYSVIKNPRLLVWKKQLGVVQLTLEFGGVERSFSVSPLHATLIMHFEGKVEKIWSLGDLAGEVALPLSVVQKKMMLWVNQGVVAESPGPKYRLVRDQAQARTGGEGMDTMALEDNTEAAVSADANDKESDKIIEHYLTGMLTNLNKLPINRIHNSLKMFMSGGDKKYEKSLPELQQLLWHLCSEGKLEQVDGEYRLVKH